MLVPMSPVRVDDTMTPTASSTRKRALTSQDDTPQTKRQRTSSRSSATESNEVATRSDAPPRPISTDELARKGLRRSIALVLERVGFDATSGEAMESFANIVETYMSRLMQDVRSFASASRRSYPIPTDFETSLTRFNLPISSLKPHLRPPVSKAKREPAWATITPEVDAGLSLPILADELSGVSEKEAKQYIPRAFPSFPSLHTYKYTPENAENATVSTDWGAFEPDIESQEASSGGLQTIAQARIQRRPLAPDEIPRGDPKKMREAAAKEAKAGEEALRRLVRASKIAKQKEVWATAQREPARRERHDLWESALRDTMEEDARASGRSFAPGATHGALGRFEIADHSMIVNAGRKYQRKEAPRASGRKTTAVEMAVGQELR